MSQLPKSSAAELRERLGISEDWSYLFRDEYTDEEWELVKWADDADILETHVRNWETLAKGDEEYYGGVKEEGGYVVGDIVMLPWSWKTEHLGGPRLSIRAKLAWMVGQFPLEPWWSPVRIVDAYEDGLTVAPEWVYDAEWKARTDGYDEPRRDEEYYEVEYPDGQRKWWVRNEWEPGHYGFRWEQPDADRNANWDKMPTPVVRDVPLMRMTAKPAAIILTKLGMYRGVIVA